MATVPRLDELEDVARTLVRDLHGVTFTDASGIGPLVALYKRCPHNQCSLLIRGVLASG